MPFVERNPYRGWRRVGMWCVVGVGLVCLTWLIAAGFDTMQATILKQVKDNHAQIQQAKTRAAPTGRP